MTVNTTQVSGGWIAISSQNATLTTALSEVITEAEAQGVTQIQGKIAIAWDSTAAKYAVVIIAKKH